VSVYFDHTDPAHLALLPVGMRRSTELEDLAPEVEQDVLNHYTRRQHDMRYTVLQPVSAPPVGVAARPTFVFTPRGYATDIGNGALVYLAGYTADSSDALCDPNLRNALRREVADVLKWRLAQLSHDVGVASVSGQGGVTKSYREHADDPFPPHFGRWLKAYDTRPPNWAF